MTRSTDAPAGSEPGVSVVHPSTGRLLRFAVHSRADVLSSTILRKCWYEPQVTSVVLGLLRPGDAFVDVGANIGWHTVMGAEAVGPGGSVIAVEPDPDNFELLRVNCIRNELPHVSLHACAVGDHAGIATLHVAERNLGDHRLYAVEGEARRQIEVPVETVDRLVSRTNLRVRLVKIDVQGFEARVLRGMTRLVEGCFPAIVMEFWPHGLVQNRDSVFDLMAFIDKFGYAVYRVTPLGLELSTIGMLLELSRTLLRPQTKAFNDIALLRSEHEEFLRTLAGR